MVYFITGIILFVCGVIIVLYSPWSQEMLREAVVNKFDGRSGLSISLDEFSLHFPIELELGGLTVASGVDTVVSAHRAEIRASVLPLLQGEFVLSSAELQGIKYFLGAPDSAMYMVIRADSVGLKQASVHLADMGISLPDGAIRGGRVDMTLNTSSTPQDTVASQPTQMRIELGRLRLDDFGYSMRMLPTIDTLSAVMAHAELRKGSIDMLSQKILLDAFSGHHLDARYIAPDAETAAQYAVIPAADSDSEQTQPWIVSIDSIFFDHSHALYTTAGVEPLPGFDAGYIEVSDLDLHLNDFYNQATTVKLSLSIRGKERSGIDLAIDGTLDIDSVALKFNDVRLNTQNGSAVAFQGLLGMGDMVADPTLPLELTLDGGFAPGDLSLAFPAFSPYFKALPPGESVEAEVNVAGTTGHLDINTLDIQINRCVNLVADGYLESFMDPGRLGGRVALRGNIINVRRLKDSFLAPETAKTFAVPPMTIAGNIAMKRGAYNGKITARTGKGKLALDGNFNGNSESYKAQLSANDFPVQSFLPDMGIGAASLSVDAAGHGFDFFSDKTEADVKANVDRIEYQGVVYTDIAATGRVAQGNASINLNSDNPDADLSLDASGNLTGNTYDWTMAVDGRHIDLYALKFATEPSSIEVTANGDATIGPGKNDMKVRLAVNDLFYSRMSGTIALSDIDAHLNSSDSLTDVTINNRDMTAVFNSPENITALAERFGSVGTLLGEQIDRFSINVDTLGKVLPRFALDVRGGTSNLVNDILAPSKMSVRSFYLSADNDSTLTLNCVARRFDTGSMRLDSLYIGAVSVDSLLVVTAGLLNNPGNLDQWHSVDMKGVVRGNRMSLGLHQENLKGDTGYEFGMRATAQKADSTITLSVNPFKPIIGYQNWSVNEDNYISYGLSSGHVDANLHMAGGNSSLAIYTEHVDSVDVHSEHGQEDLIINLGDIHISDWISFNPFAPPVKGDVNANLRINRHENMFVGRGSASIVNFIYGKERVDDFMATFDVAATPSGTIQANADLFVNGTKTITVSGALNDSTLISPMALDLSMIRFPLDAVNPFLPKGTARLRGMLNGKLKISGTDKKPVYNGTFDFDSTAVRLGLTGTDYTFSEVPIVVENSVVRFDDFAIRGCNENPLTVNGTVDISSLENLRMNLALKARDMMIVNSNRASKGADVFGKAYISLDANAHGSMSLLSVNADLKILSETNVTYIIPDATSTLANRSTDDMVKFVNFTDSLAVVRADSLVNNGMAMFLDARLTIEDGSTITVNLSADGKNKAQIQSNGTLTYEMTPLDDGRLTGRLNIDKGFVRYTPPFMSEKNFSFDEGSYVSFNGDMMNPTLNVHATDVLKANVTQTGQNSRLVNFDVSLAVKGTLSDLDVAFDLSTNDDMTVANELESMSPEQRANQAMNMLLYNVYTGPGTKGNASLAGNPLFSFLESQINTWAANNIKGIDISFGIDQYDRTLDGNTSSTMSYSYQVSKSLFNDRFKIVVGGNYSTDANADENFSQNLINDISFEYFLNKQRTMYVRLFRHTGYESILEGEITQTGVGFVYRRKLRRIGDMFLPQSLVRRREERRAKREDLKDNNESTQIQSDTK